jgi:trans-aconitate 2-methyltransferase
MNPAKSMKWNPADYAKSSDVQLGWAQELRRRLSLQGHESVLDLGCGDGKITADFARSLPQGSVVGIDQSAEMIDYARSLYARDSYPNLSFDCVDARSLTFDRQFDLCFSNAVLHWVDDHPAVLQGISRGLRSGGKVIISCGGKGNAAGLLSCLTSFIKSSGWGQYFEQFDYQPYTFNGVEDYQLWLTAAGLVIDRLELVPKDMTHANPSALRDWLRTTWMPVTDHVPEADRDRFIAEFVVAYLQEIPLDDRGQTHVKMVRLEVEAHLS